MVIRLRRRCRLDPICGEKPSSEQPSMAGELAVPVTQSGSLSSGSPLGRVVPGLCQESVANPVDG